ncbi:zinc ribbon domain-containing protein [Leptolyngbya sp. FACHB-261]|uniref:zinc ribbon domain-containing protein n=1 Tax=Leptolyngbya sp. FACHB-261 TaxID=2692806 RepID=UPI001683ED04|nr:zinc ribbon domain-containing protein [Leptolyngbya sp. FACHB-261]MBD2104660.1 zinc ribbon domain-containing protein [Leptolyngbya sp. FACHB-261]
MAYTGDLGNGQQVYVENQGTQTLISLSSSSPGQQQSQRCTLETGAWLSPPILFRVPRGLILRLESAQGQQFVHLQAGGISTLATAPSLLDADILPLQVSPSLASNQSAVEIQPMQPMQPMRMGNMEMQMNPMEMRMGDLELRMSSSQPSSTPSQTPGRFCSQCGQSVAASDRFCIHCGSPTKG